MKKAVKRAITILMGGILAAGLIAGCGKDNNTASNTPSGGNSVLLSEVTGEVSGEETESAPAAETAEQTESAAVPEEEENVVWEYTDDAFSYTMDLSEYIELPDYSNITLTTVKEEVTDEDLEAQIDYILEQNSTYETVEDRTTAISGDRAIIDFEGRMNGETFEGGSASGYGLDLGSGNFIPGFEDGIIGHEVGDKFDIELTFPEDYTE